MRYKIEKERNTYAVYEYGKVIAKGCITERDALSAIWVLNGSIEGHFYQYNDAKNVVCFGS